ncbi:MAG: hypothetical protein HC913_17765 [Microscillaceae bacterium]|nr:hypothetical protein [Microscillaceae bacterium]
MEFWTELLKIFLPTALVLYGMYLVVLTFARKELVQLEKSQATQLKMQEAELALKQKEVELKNKENVLPIRLQAYERLVLYLERISPPQIIPRLNHAEFSVGMLQQLLIQEIRNEFTHNLSQQMYISEEAWTFIKKATEETILLINNSSVGLHEDAPSLELAKKILENARAHGIYPTEEALVFLKTEVQGLF